LNVLYWLKDRYRCHWCKKHGSVHIDCQLI